VVRLRALATIDPTCGHLSREGTLAQTTTSDLAVGHSALRGPHGGQRAEARAPKVGTSAASTHCAYNRASELERTKRR
jgi:hypothetical protein